VTIGQQLHHSHDRTFRRQPAVYFDNEDRRNLRDLHFDGLVDTARKAYARLIAGLDPDERHRLIAELVTRAPEVDDSELLRSHPCPACQNTLWVVYDVVRDVEVDDSDAPHGVGNFVKQASYVASVECPVCGLDLTQSDMVLTDIPFDINLGEDEATPDEVEAWKDDSSEAFDGWGRWCQALTVLDPRCQS